MARVLGEAARYVTGQSLKKYKRQIIIVVLASFLLALVIGFWLGFSLNKHSYLWMTISIFIVVLILVLTMRLTDSISDRLERERINFRKGAVGEELVGYLLEGLPDDYTVIYGVETSFGDIDHVVVGPSGVYAIDTKNWRGVVTADGKGELFLNGKPTEKPAARNLYRTIMSIKEKIKVLSALDPFIQGVLAFPSAWVEAKWGTTGSVYCVRDEQLYDYIVEKKKKLTKKEMESILQAFLALARMDKDFSPASK
jgi:Ca2+/Na+ antiporter